MRNKKNIFYWLILGVIVVGGLYYWVSAQEKPLPERAFSNSQLLISPLPGWGIYSGPEEMPQGYNNFDRAVAFSKIRFMKPPAGVGPWSRADVDNGLWEQVTDMTQSVVKFSTRGDAREAYRTFNGFYTSVYIPPEGLEYKSPIADQFRILCDSSLPQKGGIDCFLDAQYQEFYIQVQYGGAYSDNRDNFIHDLKTISIAVDAQMEKYLGSDK